MSHKRVQYELPIHTQSKWEKGRNKTQALQRSGHDQRELESHQYFRLGGRIWLIVKEQPLLMRNIPAGRRGVVMFSEETVRN